MEIDYNSLPEVTMVQLPCYCQDIRKVESFMGGKEVLEQTILEENKNMKFSWHLTDTTRYPLIGKRNHKQGILLSLKKSASGAIVTKPLGRVTQSYDFFTPPDYQFLRTNQLLGGDFPVIGQKLECVPYPFMKNENPLDHQHLYTLEPVRTGERTKTRTTGLSVLQVRYGDPIPNSPLGQEVQSPENDFSLVEMPSPSPLTHTTITTLNFVKYYLHEIFLIRPCWSKKQLIDICVSYFEWFHSTGDERVSFHNLLHTVAAHLRNLLPHVAYLYTSGPWRNLYIKFGYNPSVPNTSDFQPQISSVLQTITLKMGQQEYNKLIQRLQPYFQEGQEVVNLDTFTVQSITSLSNGMQLTTDPTTKKNLQLICFDVPIRTQYLVQICNVRDPEFIKYFESLSQSHKLIDEAIVKETLPSNSIASSAGGRDESVAGGTQVEAVGWFYETEYEIMRKLIKRILYRRIDEFILRQQQILNLSSVNGESMRLIKPKHIAFEDRLLRENSTSLSSDGGNSVKSLATYLKHSKDQLWMNLYLHTCEEFTYPKCPQLKTSQGIVNSANRKRMVNEGSDHPETPLKPTKVLKKYRKSNTSSELVESPPPVQSSNQQIENMWAKAESFAIFDDQDVDSESSEASVVDSEWI